MPRAARFRIAAIEQLMRELEFAPASTRMRHMDAAEVLIADIDPAQNYPHDFVVYRITGYRPEAGDERVTLVGQALLPDLVNMVQVLSEGLDLPPDHAGRTALDLSAVEQRLDVSHKSIQRYRKQGLVCHFVKLESGPKKLACFEDALQRFVRGHRAQMARAAAFTRVDGEVERAIIEEARRLREAERLSLNEAARRLATRHQRAHETIRMMLRRHDRRDPQPIFTERGPLSGRETRLIHRAWMRGVEPALLARRFGKSRPTIHRAINRARADHLRGIDLSFVRLPTFDLPDAVAVILAAPAVTRDLGDAGAPIDAIDMIRAAQGSTNPEEGPEHVLLAAFNLLKMRAAAAIASLDDPPGAEALDAIETDLRWVGMLQTRLIRMALPPALRRIEQNLGRPLTHQTTDEIISHVKLAAAVVSQAIEGVDPARGQRLDRVASFAMERALAKSVHPSAAGRAAARHAPGSLSLGGAIAGLNAWHRWLGLRADLAPHVSKLPEPMRSAVIDRYGLAGFAPMTLSAMAHKLGMTSIGSTRLIQRAVRALRALAR